MDDNSNGYRSNAFNAIMFTNQKKIPIEKKTISKPKDVKKSRQIQMGDFMNANKIGEEDINREFMDDMRIPTHEENRNDTMQDEQSQRLSTLKIAFKPGYSDTKLNPSLNSGLETNLEFDRNAFNYWYYTLGKSFREYQYQIVRTCLSNNTLVALPTGLGKTFVAATVMLNFYLWFPKGKIFFLAPTRPLVNQQIECLRHFELINSNDIFEMTGNYPIPKRKEVYEKKRIFFQTPQTLENDLAEQRYDGHNLSLIIFDEAHRGTGKYAYVNIVKHFETLQNGYRILALSATPGNEFESIQEVISNLCISKLEIKDEEDPDVRKYIHAKQIIPVKILLNDIITRVQRLLSHLLNISFQYFKNLKLIPILLYKIVKNPSDITRHTAYYIQQHLKDNKDQIIEEHHTIGLSDAYDQLLLGQGKKLIIEQGVNSFKEWLYSFNENTIDKKGKPLRSKLKMQNTQEYKDLMKFMKMDQYIPNKTKQREQSQKSKSIDSHGGFEDENTSSRSMSMKNNSKCIDLLAKMSENDIESHPKSEKLIELLTEYFQSDESIQRSSKTIIFTQSRHSASELKRLLNSFDIKDEKGQKLFRSEIFIGQANLDGQGMNQKTQIETIRLFKENIYNMLIATCIGEEGLDIGEVDLIICYDSGFSPIRMGRTGRKRAGKVYIMLMEGKEYASYIQSQKRHKELSTLLKNNSCLTKPGEMVSKNRGRQTKESNKQFTFYGYNPRMIPSDINPMCRILQSTCDGFASIIQSEGESEEEQFIPPPPKRSLIKNAFKIEEKILEEQEEDRMEVIPIEKLKPLDRQQKQQEAENRVKQLAQQVNGRNQNRNSQRSRQPIVNDFPKKEENSITIFDSSFSSQNRNYDPRNPPPIQKVLIKSSKKKEQQEMAESDLRQVNTDLFSSSEKKQRDQREQREEKEVVFLKKVNPLHVFSNIEEEKINVMHKRNGHRYDSSEQSCNEQSFSSEEYHHANPNKKILEPSSHEHIFSAIEDNYNNEEEEDDDDDDELLRIAKNISLHYISHEGNSAKSKIYPQSQKKDLNDQNKPDLKYHQNAVSQVSTTLDSQFEMNGMSASHNNQQEDYQLIKMDDEKLNQRNSLFKKYKYSDQKEQKQKEQQDFSNQIQNFTFDAANAPKQNLGVIDYASQTSSTPFNKILFQFPDNFNDDDDDEVQEDDNDDDDDEDVKKLLNIASKKNNMNKVDQIFSQQITNPHDISMGKEKKESEKNTQCNYGKCDKTNDCYDDNGENDDDEEEEEDLQFLMNLSKKNKPAISSILTQKQLPLPQIETNPLTQNTINNSISNPTYQKQQAEYNQIQRDQNDHILSNQAMQSNNVSQIRNFQGIKEIIEDPNKRVIQIDKGSVGVETTTSSSCQLSAALSVSPKINENIFKAPIQPFGRSSSDLINKTDSILGGGNRPALTRGESPSDMNGFDNGQIDLSVPKKKTYEIMNDRLRKDLEKEFNPQEWNQRNKNKVQEVPKFDPKARLKQKRAQEKEAAKQKKANKEETSSILSDSQTSSEWTGSEREIPDIILPVNISPPSQPKIPQADFNDIFALLDQEDSDEVEVVQIQINQVEEDDDEEEEDRDIIEFAQKMAKSSSQQNSALKLMEIEKENKQYSKQQNTTFRKDNPYLNEFTSKDYPEIVKRLQKI